MFDAAFRSHILAAYTAIDVFAERLESVRHGGGDLTLIRQILLARAGYWQSYLWHDKDQLRVALTDYQDALRSGQPPAVRSSAAVAQSPDSPAGRSPSTNVFATLPNVCPPASDAMQADAPALLPFDMDQDLPQHFQKASAADAAASAATPSQLLQRSQQRTQGDADSLKAMEPSQLFPDTPAAERPEHLGWRVRAGMRDLWRPVVAHPVHSKGAVFFHFSRAN